MPPILWREMIQNESHIAMVTIKIEGCCRPVIGLQQACSRPVTGLYSLQAFHRPATCLQYFVGMQQACGRPAICLHLFYRFSTGLLQACHNPVHKIRPATCLLQACDKPVQALCMPVAGLPQAYFFIRGSNFMMTHRHKQTKHCNPPSTGKG